MSGRLWRSATSSSEPLTELLQRWSAGDAAAGDAAMAAVYAELRRLARVYFRNERPGHTLQATALVHEAFAQLTQGANPPWQNRAHFVGTFAGVMRRVLVDHARRRNAQKRDGQRQRVTLSDTLLPQRLAVDLLDLDQALARLERVDPQRAATVELRFFGGLSIEETAEFLGVSVATANRHWRVARAWLYQELASPPPEAAQP